MTAIADIITSGESETLEFKERFSVEVIETAVAFANNKGGRIVIGVSDSGKAIAQTFGKEVLRDYVNRIATATEPTVIPEVEKLSTPEGEIIVLSVNEFPLKPVAVRGRCYRRAGSTTRQMSPVEIAEMHLRSTGQSMDAVIVSGKNQEDLDFEAVRSYMRQSNVINLTIHSSNVAPENQKNTRCHSEQSEESLPGRICMAPLKISPVGRNDNMVHSRIIAGRSSLS
jgi:ATP-dependent DNA helicase RecG